MNTINYDEAIIRPYLNFVFSDIRIDEYIGLRILSKDKSQKLSGLYNNQESLISDIIKYSGSFNIYNSVNPLKFVNGLSVNSVKAGSSFKDTDVSRITTAYIDIDAKRIANSPATQIEIEYAERVAESVSNLLTQKNISYEANFSGNGCSILIRLPSYDCYRSEEIGAFLEMLDSQCSTEFAKVDTSVFNSSRIMRTIGTLNMKGESTQERPHRLSKTLTSYDQAHQKEYDILDLFSSEITQFKSTQVPYAYQPSVVAIKKHSVSTIYDYSKFSGDIRTLNLVDLFKRKGLYIRQIEQDKHIVLCPNRAEHSDNTDGKSSTIIICGGFPPVTAFKCHHDHCKNLDLKYFLNTCCTPEEVDTLCARPFEKILKSKQLPLLFNNEFNLVKAYDLLSQPKPDYEYVVEDILLTGGLGLMSSQPKVGKTTLLRHLCFAVAMGEDFLGKRTRKGPVIFLALEEHIYQMQKEFDKLGLSDDTELYVHAGPAPADAVEKLVPLIEKHNPILIVIDTMHKLVKFKDGNQYTEVNLALEPVLSLARKYNCSILLTHHLNKSTESNDNGRKILGSTAIQGAFDTLIYIERDGQKRTMEVEYRYQPANPIPRSIVQLNQETARLSIIGESEFKEENLDSLVLNLLKDHKSLKQEEIIKRLERQKILVLKALDRLVAEGLLEKSGNGKKGSPYVFHLKNDVPSIESGFGNCIVDQ